MPTVVVGYIDNLEGQQALDLAIEEASLREARLVVIHSMPGGSKTKEGQIVQYRRALEAVENRLSELGIEHEIHEYVRGNTPAEDLLEAAGSFDADLLVIGYRRQKVGGKTLLESHAQQILMGAEGPVLTVAAPD